MPHIPLQERSREELIALVELMLKHAPELAVLLEMPMPVKGKMCSRGDLPTVQVELIRRQIEADFQRDYSKWNVSKDIASDLEPLLDMAESYRLAGQQANALTIYRILVEETAVQTEALASGDHLYAILQKCLDGIAACLSLQNRCEPAERLTPEFRLEILHSLYRLWRYDTFEFELGEFAYNVPETIADNVTPEENAEVERWLRAEPPAENEHAVRAAGKFLLRIRKQSGADPDELLTGYEQFGMHHEKAELLLEQGRVEEAIPIVEKHLFLHQVHTFAEKLAALGGAHTLQALHLLERRLSNPHGTERHMSGSSWEWLIDQYTTRNLPVQALRIAHRRFELQLDAENFAHVCKVALLSATIAAHEPQLRQEMLTFLEDHDKWDTLIEIYLNENQVREALDAFAQGRYHTFGSPRSATRFEPLLTRLAEATAPSYPDEAIDLYTLLAEQRLAERSKANVRQAAQFLLQTRELYRRTAPETAWKHYLSDLIARNKPIPTLRQELKAAGIPEA